MLPGEIAELSALRAHDIAGTSHVMVNELLVGDINKRGQENDAGSKKTETPERHNLDEEICNQGSCECLH